ncbi:probable disease resistance protein At1g52660 [Cryptomeria japonica]|uniref:probable disease resistance protein At1g52660 n=1 Tax=Cryptomeria japonica TaxID=3369 RepID=UPI0027DA32DD|nr:probable disease resistance protein At1g52660 [Cryptomeria japonica]
MADPGFISGMNGFAIQLAASRVTRDINVAIRCRKELDTLKVLLLKIQSMNMEMQQYRKALNSCRLTTSPHHTLPSTVNSWLEELNALLEEASDLAQHCTVPSYSHLFSGYRTSKKIRRLIENVEKHVASTPSVAFLHQMQQQVTNQQVLEQIKEKVDSLNLRTSGFACTSGDPIPSTSSASPNKKYVEEALIVGQDSASNRLVELIYSQQHKNVSRFGLAGKGGAGKTLLLKRVFNSDQVQSLFRTDLMLWLTISQNPSFSTLRNDLVKQIALKVNEILDSRDEDRVKTWLNETMRKHKFALFLDDVWETSATSFEGVLPMGIDQEIARRVCNECGGLPLALKVVGQAMAGITQSNEWELAVKRLQNDVTNSLYGKLRLSYDAMADLAGYGISLQLCFLCLAA